MNGCGLFHVQTNSSVDDEGLASDPHIQYINRVLLSVWRDWHARVEAARAPLSLANYHDVNAQLGLPVDAKDIPKEVYGKWSDLLNEFRRSKKYKYPKGFDRLPVPPQMPPNMFAYMWQPTGWERVVPSDTKHLPIPPDPIRVRHDAEFLGIFEELSSNDVCIRPQEIPNQYYKDEFNLEPWYTFPMRGAQITMGPRKRVISIQATRGTPFDVGALAELAKADGVTFDADSTLVTNVLIHAWTPAKTVEYLDLIFKALSAP